MTNPTTTYPVEKLTDPEVPDWITTGVSLTDFILGNALSPTYYLNVIISLTPLHPVEAVQKYFGGDWEELGKSAVSVSKLAEYNTAFSQSIDAAMLNVESSWSGNAATSAENYFTKLTAALDGQVEPLSKISDAIVAFAHGSLGIAQSIQAAIQELGDLALQWVLTKLAQAAASWTGVGAAALEAASWAIVLLIKTKALETIRLLGDAVTVAETACGAIWTALATSQEFEIPDLTGAYDHPGVY